MSHIHILTNSERIKNTDDKIYKILSSNQEQIYLKEGLSIQEHIYKLQCGEVVYEVNCPEIQNKKETNGDSYLILPEFMIPGRPYPIYVYLYAIEIYTMNPGMGQRKAAEITRKSFGLTTFSHTTLGRAMKKLERQIKKYDSEHQSNDEAENQCGESFSTVDQTKKRRDTVNAYLKKASADSGAVTQETLLPRARLDYRRPPYIGAFIDVCHNIVQYTFLNYHCILL